MQQLTLIVKATRRCNLRCEYCHDWRARDSIMDFDVMAAMIQNALTAKRFSGVEFIWHGGEPLTAGRSFYLKALYLQRKLGTGRAIQNSLQTNGVLLDAEWCDFFGEAGFRLGLSLDGPSSVHDQQRKSVGGRGSHSRAEAAVELLRSRDLPHGALAVLGRPSLELGAAELYWYFRALGLKSWDYLPARPPNHPTDRTDRHDYVTHDEYVAFMIETFDVWASDETSGEVSIREIKSILNKVVGVRSDIICTMAGGCLGRYFQIDPNGDIYHCDKFMDVVDYRIGNVMDTNFDDLYESSQIRTLREAEATEHESLSRCPHYRVCSGGCPHDRFLRRRYFPGEAIGCCGLGRLISHIEQAVAGLPAASELSSASAR